MNENGTLKNEIDTLEHRNRLMAELMNHIGSMHAIGMAELYEIVFAQPWSNRINDTRPLRKLITIMKREGRPICSSAKSTGGGYYIAAAGSETNDFLRRNENRALKILGINAIIKRINLPNYLGQMKFNMEGGENEAA